MRRNHSGIVSAYHSFMLIKFTVDGVTVLAISLADAIRIVRG